jgi:hypothetical protein
MKTQKTLLVFLILALIGLFGYGCYRKGYSDATSKAAANYEAEYRNDWSNDPSVKHSTGYSLGYASGHAEGHLKGHDECIEQLVQIVVETRDTKFGAELLAHSLIAPSQIEKAEAQYEQRQPNEK